MKGFGSDNHSGVHPEILQSIINCNVDHEPSYGTDQYSEVAIKNFKKKFGESTEVFFVFNGTACNVLALRFLVNRFESVLCSDVSHLHVDECGAPEFFAGKLISLPQQNGKINLQTVKDSLIRKGDQHFSQIRCLSLTQPTELGTCYTLQEIKEFVDWAHANQMYVHLDGARLVNATRFLKCTLKEMTTDLGVDVVSFGGTKNGLLFGEAILVLNPILAKKAQADLKYIRKQSAQLPSKTRFIAAQFSAYLQENLYQRIADHSCQMAEILFQGLKKIPQIKITCERQSNAVFATIPQPWIKKLREHAFFYVWDEKTFECRLMTSWDTTTEDIQKFIKTAEELSKN